MSRRRGIFHSRPEHACPEKASRLWDQVTEDSASSSRDGAVLILRLFSVFTAALPYFKKYVVDFVARFKDAIVDRDMKSDLEGAGVINWCRTARKLYPLKTTGDGNCLLHAVSQYLWGVEDQNMVLRRIMYVNITEDPNGIFKKRWLVKQRLNEANMHILDRQNTEDFTTEWESVIKGTEDMTRENNCMQFTCLESIHLYILANMLKRPILLLADSQARSVFGLSLQESDLAGVYLPLDIPDSQCSKTPIILGYNLNHFAPLLSEENGHENNRHTQRQLAVPLITKNFEMLPIRYLLPDEEKHASNLIKKYLKMTELVYSQNDNMIPVPAAEIEHQPLQKQFNIMEHFVEDCEVKFQVSINQSPLLHPHNQGVGPKSLGAVHQQEPQRVQLRNDQLAETEQYQQLQNRKKCLVVGCENHGNVEYSNMCYRCFKEFTVQYHKQELEAHRNRTEANFHDLSMMGEDCKAGCGFKCSTQTYPFCHECLPKFEAENLQVGQELPLNSLLPEKCCKQACENYCSTATYPYCHPCFANNQQESVVPTAPPPSFLKETGQNRQSDVAQVLQGFGNNRQLNPNLTARQDLQPLQLQQPLIGILNYKCSTELCSKFAVKGNNGKCDECYADTMFGTGASPVLPMLCSTTGCGKLAFQETNKCKDCFVKAGNMNTSLRNQQLPPNIPIEGTVMGNVPVFRPEPQQHDEKAAMPSPHHQNKYICARPGCNGVRLSEKEKYCNSCRNIVPSQEIQTPIASSPDSNLEMSCTPVDLTEAEMKKLNPIVLSSKQKVKCAYQGCDHLIYPPKQLCDSCSAALEQMQATKSLSESTGSVRCQTAGCKFFGSPQFNGYCSKCSFSTPKAKENTRHTFPLTSQRREIVQYKHATAPLSGKGSGKPCIEPGCQRFGDPNQGDRCSHHYEEAMRRIPQNPKTNIHHRIHPNGMVEHSQSTGSLASHAATSNHDPSPVVDKFISGLSKVESSRKSTNICKNQDKTGCTNYGNSSKKGFCNTCYPDVQRMERGKFCT